MGREALVAPAVARNRAAILGVLRDVLPETGTILEIASGSGEHVVHFAAALPALTWQPSDPEPAYRRSIAAHAEAAGLTNLRAPLALDAADAAWPIARADAILCINMVHIAPWSATEGLMDGAARTLASNSPAIRANASSASVPPDVMKCALHVGTSSTPAAASNTLNAPPTSLRTVR